MRSTITAARQRLVDLAPGLNQQVYGRLKAELDAAERDARARAEQFYSQHLEALDGTRRDLLVEACSVRDDLEHLAAEAALGRMSAADFGRRLDALTSRRDRVERDLAEADRRLDVLGGIEDDPEAWADDLARRFPSTQPEFSF